MFVPGDPRFDEMLKLADAACSNGLTERQRGRWRELSNELLGRVNEGQPEFARRRQYLRADAELEVHILAPDEMASLATSTIGAGGLSLVIAEEVPVGTVLELSIKMDERPMPLLVKAQVMWSKPGALGAAFIDLFQNERELIEGVAVKALLARAALG